MAFDVHNKELAVGDVVYIPFIVRASQPTSFAQNVLVETLVHPDSREHVQHTLAVHGSQCEKRNA